MATKRQSQLRLTDFMSRTKRPVLDKDLQSSSSEKYNMSLPDINSYNTRESESESKQVSTCNESRLLVDENACTTICCRDLTKVYQPTNKETLGSLFNQRNFCPEWFKHIHGCQFVSLK